MSNGDNRRAEVFYMSPIRLRRIVAEELERVHSIKVNTVMIKFVELDVVGSIGVSYETPSKDVP